MTDRKPPRGRRPSLEELKAKKAAGGRSKRHSNGYIRICASMPVELATVFKELGGSAWLQEQIRNRPTKYQQEIKRICISLPVELAPAFKELGGSAWLQEQIKKALRKK